MAIDLYAGLGGWTEGLLAEGYRVIGFDIEDHEYLVPETLPERDGCKGTRPMAKRGWTQGCAVSLGMEGANSQPCTRTLRYPGQLVIQDVLTLHGSQFKDAALIVASPPCQEYSYMAMPWKRAKAKAAAIRADTTGAELERLNRLFNACFRIQKEASLAAGRHIPMVVENVRGAIPWVGRSRWNFGSFHLWGDVPALMPFTFNGQKFNPDGTAHGTGSWFAIADSKNRGTNSAMKNNGIKQSGLSGMRDNGKGDKWFQNGAALSGSKSHARKAASAMIARIPA
ncbi:MAG: hypothetical protein ACREJC_17590, partial [Tepidisphaeraceae bacterium]